MKSYLTILAWIVIFVTAFCVGCRKKPPEETEANAQQPPTEKIETKADINAPAPNEDEYALVPVECVVYHSGYRGIIVAPGVSKPTDGTVVGLECNGENVELLTKEIVDGYINTKEFGKVGVRFRSTVLTVGEVDFTSVAAGKSLPERAIKVYILKSKVEDFKNRFLVEPTTVTETGPDSVAVTVNGFDIMESQIEALVKPQLEKMAEKYPQISPAFKKQLRQGVLERMIVEQLLDEQVKASGITVTEEEAINRLEEMASAQQPPLSLDNLKTLIEAQGQSFEQVKQRMQKGLTYEKLLQAQFGDKLKVTEDDARKYYSENKSQFETPEQVRASHILIQPDTSDPNTDPNQAKAQAKAKAEELLKQIKNGADFAELAKANSDCPSAARGGDLNFFSRGDMVPTFEKAAFELKVDQVSDVVETRYGYHIIKVTDHKDASAIPFEQAKDDIIIKLTQEKQGEFAHQYVESLKAQANIVYPPNKEPEQK